MPIEMLEGIRVRPVSAEEQTNYPITLSVDDFGDDFQLTAQTVTDIDPNVSIPIWPQLSAV
ncbi:hypothetical protein [Xenorhabdus thailandensis]|uniref:hypothetical protein n=1 Tax=Xenorhabdus thailandensis TaxID=3136255 RepID=UPI0030F4112D